jgi:HAD superfamily hydrolase (TIGR01509 family)
MLSSVGSGARAVALDLDGVLIDGMPIHVEAWQRVFRARGIEVEAQDIFKLEGIPSARVVDAICTSQGLSFSSAERDDIVSAKRKLYRELFTPVPLPGAVPLVMQLSSYGYALGVVTGTLHAVAEHALAALGIRELFAVIVSVDSTGKGKPAPDPYLKFLSELRLPSPDCLVVENAPAGIAAACAAGLLCVAVATYLPSAHLSHADFTFSDLAACSAWFEQEHAQSRGVGSWRESFSQMGKRA